MRPHPYVFQRQRCVTSSRSQLSYDLCGQGNRVMMVKIGLLLCVCLHLYYFIHPGSFAGWLHDRIRQLALCNSFPGAVLRALLSVIKIQPGRVSIVTVLGKWMRAGQSGAVWCRAWAEMLHRHVSAEDAHNGVCDTLHHVLVFFLKSRITPHDILKTATCVYLRTHTGNRTTHKDR